MKSMHSAQPGLPALSWSDDLYNCTTLPHAKDISHTYNSDGIVYRRESDGSVVANKWLGSGIRELLMSPDATQAAVAVLSQVMVLTTGL